MRCAVSRNAVAEQLTPVLRRIIAAVPNLENGGVDGLTTSQ